MTAKMFAFLQAMLEESTIAKAAEKAGISRKTAYVYLHNEEFNAELEKRRSECINDTVRYLQGKLALCGETLVDIIADPDAGSQVKINAVNTIYANCRAFVEQEEIIKRIEKVENRLKE